MTPNCKLSKPSGGLARGAPIFNAQYMGDHAEAELPSVAQLSRVFETAEQADGAIDYGVSKEQVYAPEQHENNEGVWGSRSADHGGTCAENRVRISKKIRWF